MALEVWRRSCRPRSQLQPRALRRPPEGERQRRGENRTRENCTSRLCSLHLPFLLRTSTSASGVCSPFNPAEPSPASARRAMGGSLFDGTFGDHRVHWPFPLSVPVSTSQGRGFLVTISPPPSWILVAVKEKEWFMEMYTAGNISWSLLRSKVTGTVGTQDAHTGRRDFLHKISPTELLPPPHLC